IDKKLADASKRTESRLERLSAETEKRLADLVTQLEEVTAATAPLATEFNKLAVLFRRGSQTLPGPSTDGAALTAAANKFDLSGIMADLMEDPRKAFRDALVQRDISAMRVATQRAVDRNVGVFEEATMVSMLLALGDEGAVTLAERIWQQYRSTTMTAEIASVLLGGSVRFYVNHNRAKEFEPKAKEIAGFVTDEYPESTPSEKAFVINQLGILAHSYDLDAALAYTKRAIELNPDEPSYYHNVSIVLEENNRIGLAVKYAEDAIARGSEEKDPAHFRQAIDVYVRRLAEQKSTDTPSSEITGTEDRLRTLSRELRTIDDTAWRVAYAEYEVLRMLDPQ
ncbi:MAG: hypothetical protein O7H39_15350, partial [Gammaproteobacteria bacterium]|nr:hypothetical protein [Gammaproteobacteria bacterium]